MPFLRDSSTGSINFCVFLRFRCFLPWILPPEASISVFSCGFDAFSSGFFLRKHQFPFFLAVSMLFLRDPSSKSINSYDFRSFRCFSPGRCFRLEPRLILQTLGHKQQQVIIVNAGRILIQYLPLIPHSASVRNISALYVYPLRRTVTRMNSHSKKNSI